MGMWVRLAKPLRPRKDFFESRLQFSNNYGLPKLSKGKQCLNVLKRFFKYLRRGILIYKGKLSSFFFSNVGLRQGENLSPLLFAIF